VHYVHQGGEVLDMLCNSTSGGNPQAGVVVSTGREWQADQESAEPASNQTLVLDMAARARCCQCDFEEVLFMSGRGQILRSRMAHPRRER
jgi:hypothetical protein